MPWTNTTIWVTENGTSWSTGENSTEPADRFPSSASDEIEASTAKFDEKLLRAQGFVRQVCESIEMKVKPPAVPYEFQEDIIRAAGVRQWAQHGELLLTLNEALVNYHVTLAQFAAVSRTMDCHVTIPEPAPAAPRLKPPLFSPGDLVEHEAFGRGTIVEVEPREQDVYSTVEFAGGRKHIACTYLRAAGSSK